MHTCPSKRPITAEEVAQYFFQNANPNNRSSPNENSIDGEINDKQLKLPVYNARAKRFKNVFSNDVII